MADRNAAPPSPSPTPPPTAAQMPSQPRMPDQNLIKSLLANRLQQNMTRVQNAQNNMPVATQDDALSSVSSLVSTQNGSSNSHEENSNSTEIINNAPNASSAFENEFQQFMQVKNAEATMSSNRVRRKSINVTEQGASKRQKLSDVNSETSAPAVDTHDSTVPSKASNDATKQDSSGNERMHNECGDGLESSVCNGITVSDKDVPSNALNNSIEEKKAMIAKLMMDTQLCKEQMQGLNGLTANCDVTAPSVDAVVSVSQSLLCDANLVTVNGFPESMNGNHLHTDGDSRVVELDDLNRNNNCNGDDEDDGAPPASPGNALVIDTADSSLPTSTETPTSVKAVGATCNPLQGGISNVTNPSLVQSTSLPAVISTPKVIMSALPQSVNTAQSQGMASSSQYFTTANVQHNHPGQLAPATVISDFVAQATSNQLLAQPQLLQSGQIAPTPSLVTNPPMLQQQQQQQQPVTLSVQQSAPLAVQLNQGNPGQNHFQLSPQQLQQVVQQLQGQLVQAQSQAAADPSQGTTQILQQSLAGQVVQQLLQQAQLAQQTSSVTQNQGALVQQAPQVNQPVFLQQGANQQVLSTVVPTQLLVQTQSAPQVTVSLAQAGVSNHISLNVGQVVQQQVLVPQQQQQQQQHVIGQPVQNRQILPQPQMSVQQSQNPVLMPTGVPQQQNAIRFISQPASNTQLPIHVSTTQLSNSNLALFNGQQMNSASAVKPGQYPVMQQQLHASNPSIVTPPPASPQSSRSSPGPMPSPGGTKSLKRPPSRQSDTSDKPKKKRSKSKEQPPQRAPGTSAPSPANTPQSAAAAPMVVQYMCEWRSCNK